MTTSSMTMSRGFSFKPIAILLLLAFIGIMFIGLAFSHAESKHGEEMAAIRQCFDGNPSWKFLMRGNNVYCQRINNQFYFRVTFGEGEREQELTIYKNNIKNVQELQDYVKSNNGKWIKTGK